MFVAHDREKVPRSDGSDMFLEHDCDEVHCSDRSEMFVELPAIAFFAPAERHRVPHLAERVQKGFRILQTFRS